MASLLIGSPAAAQVGIQVGAKAPALVLPDLDGKPVDLAGVIGKKPIFLEFWATWCSECEALLPRVQAAYSAYGDRVAFYGIGVGVNQTPAKLKEYSAKHGVPFPTLFDQKGAGVRAYGVNTTSAVVIIDRTGKVVYTGAYSDQEFEKALKQVAG
ncbi:MAG: TlpA family protein disulfide reductase [Gemmatimonadota bacterium]